MEPVIKPEIMKNCEVGSQKEIFSFLKADCYVIDSVSYYEDQNVRPYMEDKHFAEDDIYNGEQNPSVLQLSIFGILDGHGGQDVVRYCCNNLPNMIIKQFETYNENTFPYDKEKIEQIFTNIFQECNNKLEKEVELADQQGCCACVMLVIKTKSKRYIYVINLGDTRAVLGKNGEAKRMSQDHKASEPLEIERINQFGGVIFRGRVGGSLAVTRALGDLNLRDQGLIIVPHVEEFILQNTDKDETFMILASDGLWDVCADEKAVYLLFDKKNKKSIFYKNKMLIEYALKEHSRDNTSVMIIKF